MNTHQPIFPTTIIAISNVSILGTQAMNLSIAHTVVHVIYQTTWSQLVTPIILGKIGMLPTSTYRM
jgi:hypothetical protein